MKKALLVSCFLICTLCANSYIFNIRSESDIKRAVLYFQDKTPFLDLNQRIDLIQHLYAYLMAYHRYIHGISIRGEKIYFLMKNGSRILYDDRKKKSFSARLASPSLKDTMHDPYPLVVSNGSLPLNTDPGRYRNHKFLRAVYGSGRRGVSRNLVKVRLNGKTYLFNKQNGAADALKKVDKDLMKLLKKKPGYKKFITDIEGTYIYRRIAGSKQLSAHSYGIAIDLKLKLPYYWKHNKVKLQDGKRVVYTLPAEIVEIFERHGFIWGGKWYHYDNIHLEYRPEFFYNLF